MTDAPCIIGAARERVRSVAAAGFTVTPGFEEIVDQLDLGGRAFLVDVDGEEAVADGNRSVVLPGRRVTWRGRTWALGVKGVGARTVPFSYDEPARRAFGDESWLGEAPWGAQGEANARQAATVSMRWASGDYPGVQLCPTIAVATLPRVPSAPHRYRRHRGPFIQELRLVPSNVRLYHGSELALGPDPTDALRAFDVTDAEALDAFLDRFLRSGVALLTLYARAGLVYDDVWLDKDALVAPNGDLCFADLEGLDYPPKDDALTSPRITEQFHRKLYEWLFAVDALLATRERLAGAVLSEVQRRQDLALRLELALTDDPVVTVLRDGGDLDLLVRPLLEPEHTVRLRLIDA